MREITHVLGYTHYGLSTLFNKNEAAEALAFLGKSEDARLKIFFSDGAYFSLKIDEEEVVKAA